MSYFSPYIDGTGLHMPTYDDRLAELWDRYCEIFSADPDTDSSAPDYQLLSLFARVLDDVSQFVVQVYDSMNPGIEPDNVGFYYITGYQSAPSAAGNALDLLMAQYGTAREYIPGGYPEPVIEDFRCRRKMMSALAEKGSVDLMALEASVRNVFDGMDVPVRVYLNDTDMTDSLGIPPRCVAVVVDELGTGTEKRMQQVAQAIFNHLTPGIGTYGDTGVTVKDAEGGEHTVHFSRAETILMYTVFYVTKQAGADEDLIEKSVAPRVVEYINALPCGVSLPLSRLIGVAYAANPEIADTYVITSVMASVDGSGWIRDVVNCPWNKYLFAGSMTGWMIQFVFS